MRRRSLFAPALAAAILALSSLAASAQDVLRWGYNSAPFPPFTSKSASGQWTGFDVDIMNALCRQMQAKCDIVDVAWDGIIPALQANKIDIIWTGMSMTPERDKVVDFTDRYRRGPAAFIAERGRRSRSPSRDCAARSSACRRQPTSSATSSIITARRRG